MDIRRGQLDRVLAALVPLPGLASAASNVKADQTATLVLRDFDQAGCRLYVANRCPLTAATIGQVDAFAVGWRSRRSLSLITEPI